MRSNYTVVAALKEKNLLSSLLEPSATSQKPCGAQSQTTTLAVRSRRVITAVIHGLDGDDDDDDDENNDGHHFPNISKVPGTMLSASCIWFQQCPRMAINLALFYR